MSLKEKLYLLNPIYWPAWLALGLLWLSIKLPLRWQMRLGEYLGKITYIFAGKLRRITQTNIKLCFPELTPAEQTILIKKNFASLGIGIIEGAMAWWLPDKKLQRLFQISGAEHLKAGFAKGKGVLLIGPHFTSLEIVGRLLGKTSSLAVMYRPHKKRFIAFLHEHFRKKSYVNYIPRHRVRDLFRALNQNTAIWYAYDIDGGLKHSVFAPFFSISTSSLTAVSRIAKISDAAIVPISFYRLENQFKYEVVLSPPLDTFPSGDLIEDATRLNAVLEDAIRTKPEQYIWQYKRFKTRPEKESRFY